MPGWFRYGAREPVILRSAGQPTNPSKCLAFQADLGGFNNILMNFEIMVVLAALTGRTLILPPPEPFYLLGDAPRSLLDFFDRSSLERHIHLVTADEFVRRRGLDSECSSREGFHAFMREHGFNPGWNCSKDAVVDPPDALTTRFELIPRLLRRRPVAFVGEPEHCDVLYFRSTAEHRLLGPVETFFLLADPSRERRVRALVRDGVRYHPRILALAEQLLASPLLTTSFGAIHVRRGDFQYRKTRIAAGDILQHTNNLFESGQTIYVSTDEEDAAFLEQFRKRYRVVNLGLLKKALDAAVPYHFEGILETLICAAAPGRFVGTRLSTFSARIATIRGYLSTMWRGPLADIDTALYYTQPPLASAVAHRDAPYRRPAQKHRDELGETDQEWWKSAATAPLWGRAYSAVWAQAD